jgi:hypothetical protein
LNTFSSHDYRIDRSFSCNHLRAEALAIKLFFCREAAEAVIASGLASLKIYNGVSTNYLMIVLHLREKSISAIHNIK